MRNSTTSLAHRLLGSAAALTLVVSLAACSAPTTGTGTDTGSSTAVAENDFAAARDAYDLAFAQCLRDQGLDVQDPKPGEGIQETGPEIDAAVPTCLDEVGDPPVSDGGKLSDAQLLEIWLKEADCFRDLGYEVEEPTLTTAYTIPENATDDEVQACLVPQS